MVFPVKIRNLAIFGCVLLAHVALLWAAQGGLTQPKLPIIVPVEILGQFVASSAATNAAASHNLAPVATSPLTPPPVAPKPLKEVPKKITKQTQIPVIRPRPPSPSITPTTPPEPAAQVADDAPTAPLASESSATSESSQASTNASHDSNPNANFSSDSSAGNGVATEQLPSGNASYLHNPKPKYPPLSRRLGEQGISIVKVQVNVDGTAVQAEIFESSGFERLDRAAIKAVLSWRYAPGTRNGIAQKMWFNVPINWVLE